jgi:hypothetical protein
MKFIQISYQSGDSAMDLLIIQVVMFITQYSNAKNMTKIVSFSASKAAN